MKDFISRFLFTIFMSSTINKHTLRQNKRTICFNFKNKKDEYYLQGIFDKS